MINVHNNLHTVFHGDKYNNYFTSIKKNSYIYFSRGIDIYLLDNLIIVLHLILKKLPPHILMKIYLLLY